MIRFARATFRPVRRARRAPFPATRRTFRATLRPTRRTLRATLRPMRRDTRADRRVARLARRRALLACLFAFAIIHLRKTCASYSGSTRDLGFRWAEATTFVPRCDTPSVLKRQLRPD